MIVNCVSTCLGHGIPRSVDYKDLLAAGQSSWEEDRKWAERLE